jgi:hypothetical protein
MYSSYSFTNSSLGGGEWSASRPGYALPPGKGPSVPILQEGGGPQTRSGLKVSGKISCLCRGSNLDRSVVQSVARHYNYCATGLVVNDIPRRNYWGLSDRISR